MIQQFFAINLVVPLGLEPRLGTDLVRLVYKTSDATLHHRTKIVKLRMVNRLHWQTHFLTFFRCPH